MPFARLYITGIYLNCFLRQPAPNELGSIQTTINALAAAVAAGLGPTGVINDFYFYLQYIERDLLASHQPQLYNTAVANCRTHTDNALHQLNYYTPY